MNSSKTRDPRYWRKWKEAGATGTYWSALLRDLNKNQKEARKKIHETSQNLIAMDTEKKHIRNMAQLIDFVGSSPGGNTNVTAKVTLWDGRILQAVHETKLKDGFMVGDVESREDVIWDDAALKPCVEQLLQNGTPFFTVTGTHDMVNSLKWSLH